MTFESELQAVAEGALSMFGKDGGSSLTLYYFGAPVFYYEEDETARNDLVLGGLAESTDKVVRVLKSHFSKQPLEHQSVSIAGEKWKIRSVSGSAGDPEIRLTLINPNRRG